MRTHMRGKREPRTHNFWKPQMNVTLACERKRIKDSNADKYFMHKFIFSRLTEWKGQQTSFLDGKNFVL